MAKSAMYRSWQKFQKPSNAGVSSADRVEEEKFSAKETARMMR